MPSERERVIDELLKQHGPLIAIGPRVDGTRQIAGEAYDAGYKAGIEAAAKRLRQASDAYRGLKAGYKEDFVDVLEANIRSLAEGEGHER